MCSDEAHDQWKDVSGCEPFARHLSPLRMVLNLWNQRELIKRFTRREIEGRYKGTSLGLLWSFASPLFLLAIYTLVFGTVLHSKWPEAKTGSLPEFALTLFCGLIVFNVFQECMSAAALLIFRHPSYVKKVVFPLEIFSFCLVGSAMFHALLSLIVLVGAIGVINHELPWTLVWLPVVILPLIMLVLGFCWLLSSLGVFFRDLQQFIVIFLTALIFATPIFYSTSSLPPLGQRFMVFNPLAMMVENMRKVMLWGESPAWMPLGVWMLVSGVVMLLGYAIFMRTKRAFSDYV
jgi:lipopolysaccharide transport system permease protein